MNSAQLEQLLDAIQAPARVLDNSGSIIAQNERAADSSAAVWDAAEIRDLGEGLALHLAALSSRAEADALVHGMAHSLRNPLSAIVTAASLIKDDPAIAGETAMLVGILDRESRHLNRIVTEYLNYLRPRRGESTKFDLAEALRSAILAAKKDLPSAGTRIHDSLAPDLWVLADENRVRQALWQVVANAFEAMPEGGTLTVSGMKDEGTISLTVEDDGKGCSDSEMPRLFEPFFSSKPESTGLGLPSARSAVEAAGGTIWGERIILPQGKMAGMRLHLRLPAADL